METVILIGDASAGKAAPGFQVPRSKFQVLTLSRR